MSTYFFRVQQSNVLVHCLYLLLATTIVTKSINCFVLENTNWSTVLADANKYGISENTTTPTNDNGSSSSDNGDATMNFLPKISDTANIEYLISATDGTSMDDIETGKY